MKRLIECVPNFSEGRDAAKVDAIVSAMSAVAGVYVLDKEMDADHNRCVVTLAGEPEIQVAEGGAARRGKSAGVDRFDGAPRCSSASWRGGCDSLHSDIRRDHRRLRGAGAARWERDLDAVSDSGVFL